VHLRFGVELGAGRAVLAADGVALNPSYSGLPSGCTRE
jgi:hypothetical protein